MVIFHSYVKLPEGIHIDNEDHSMSSAENRGCQARNNEIVDEQSCANQMSTVQNPVSHVLRRLT